jgi:hypothetical protein
MAINLTALVGQETEDKLRSGILHKIAAEFLRSEGFKVGEELDLKSAIGALGTQAFLKNAEVKTIFEGLVALHELS